jgi:putative cardiolipin synthase
MRPRDMLNKSPVGEQLLTGVIDRYWAPFTLFVDDPEKITRKADAAYQGSVTEGALASSTPPARRQDRLAVFHSRPARHGA